MGLTVSSWYKGSHKKDTILVVIDCYTKSAGYYMVTSNITASQLVDLMARKLVLRSASFPTSTVTDRGTHFTLIFLKALCHHLRIKHWHSTVYYLQTDWQTERWNHTLEQYLCTYVNCCQDNWVYLFSMAEFAYNNSVHSALGVSPYFAKTGWNPRLDNMAWS